MTEDAGGYLSMVGEWARSRIYAVLAFLVACVGVATFLAAESLNAPWLAEPRSYLTGAHPWVAALAVALLAGDVLLPVPSSGVMVALGTSFGGAGGAVLSLIGGASATLVAFAVGRRGQRLIDRLASAETQERARQLLARHGFWAIVATRPLPVVAETVGVLSGAAGAMAWWKVTLAGVLGNLLPAVAYAQVGAQTADHVSGVVIVATVMGLSALMWLGQRGLHSTRR